MPGTALPYGDCLPLQWAPQISANTELIMPGAPRDRVQGTHRAKILPRFGSPRGTFEMHGGVCTFAISAAFLPPSSPLHQNQ